MIFKLSKTLSTGQTERSRTSAAPTCDLSMRGDLGISTTDEHFPWAIYKLSSGLQHRLHVMGLHKNNSIIVQQK